MDARPQRPARAIRVQADENTVPYAQSKQTIHQRHKSTGTLSTMLAVGGLKAAAKRTAFGDVSNTIKNIGVARDDSAVIGKTAITEFVKPNVQHDKPAALLRPAQRPISNNVIKPVQAIMSAPITELAPTALASKVDAKLPPVLKRAQSKKLPSIFRDDDQQHRPEPDAIYQTVRSDSATIPPVHQVLGTWPSEAREVPTLRRTESHIVPAVGLEVENELAAQKEVVENVPADQQEVETNDVHSNVAGAQEAIPPQVAAAYEIYLKDLVQAQAWSQGVEENKIYDEQRQLPPLPHVSEPEEYWEDEEEEVYDEQGYTTAHSYPSRGDNTTGGATTVLFPKVTNKVKQELAAAKDLVESQRTQEEIEDEAWDTSMVAEYGEEIFGYMRELEIKMLPNAHYMDLQTEIQWSMRSVLMDWLIQVHHRFSLLPETLFLCVNYIDRFLSCKIVSLGKLQLVGATAIFVAAKYEEINCPSVSEIVYMVDGGYTVDEILKAERFMLSMLQFELGWPGPMSFLRRISKADDYDLETRTLAKYFLEVTIMDERFVGSPPSYVAAGAHCFSRLLLKKGEWTPAHAYYSGYTWTQLRPLVSLILECCENPQKHHSAVYDKYADRRYKRASFFTQSELSKGFVLPPTYTYRPSLPSMEDIAAQMPFETRDAYKRMVPVKTF